MGKIYGFLQPGLLRIIAESAARECCLCRCARVYSSMESVPLGCGEMIDSLVRVKLDVKTGTAVNAQWIARPLKFKSIIVIRAVITPARRPVKSHRKPVKVPME